MLLLPLLISTSLASTALALAIGRRQSSTEAGPCFSVFYFDTTTRQPAKSNILYDTDTSFVYNASSCASTNQKIIPPTWGNECAAAIDAACGATTPNPLGGAGSVDPAVTGSWTWGWHTTKGSTCQAGLLQASGAGDEGGVGLLTTDCCKSTLGIMAANLMRSDYDPKQGNRMSVNVLVPGGFPGTEREYGNGTTADTNGFQVDDRYPAYILQGVSAPYPYSSPNCTEEQIT